MTDKDSDFAKNRDPEIQRVRHESKRRELDVVGVDRITPHMIRVKLGGAQLEGFSSASPDDHVKVSFPVANGSIERRDYTPRRYDAARGELLIDFVDHDGGPATAWARAVKVGDHLEIGGPRGSRVIAGDIPNWLLIGDETALPAIGRRLEEMHAGTRVTTLIAVPGATDEQAFETKAKLEARWVHRSLNAADDPAPLLEALKAIELSPRTFVWIAAEASVARILRRYFIETRTHSLQWLKAAGYWVKGEANADVKDVEAA
jgi:NADPH-dependent ferric siderophore reductase